MADRGADIQPVRLKYSCHICGKEMSRKQRLSTHLSSVHGHTESSSVRYKQYEHDASKAMPRSTKSDHRLKLQKAETISINPLVDNYELVSTDQDDTIESEADTFNNETSELQAACDSTEQTLRVIMQPVESEFYDSNAEISELQAVSEPMEQTLPVIMQPVESEFYDSNAEISELQAVSEPMEQTLPVIMQPVESEFYDSNAEISELQAASESIEQTLPVNKCDQSGNSKSENNSDSESELSDYMSDEADNEDDLLFSDVSLGHSEAEDCSFFQERISERDPCADKSMTILSYLLKYNMNGTSSKDMLELIRLLSEENSDMKGISLNKIKSSVETSKIQVRDFCDTCYTLFPIEETIFECIQPECSGLRFKGTMSEQERCQRKSYFACLPIDQQIQDILQGDGIWNAIQDYKQANKKETDVADITTGSLYKDLCKEGNFMSNENNISLLFNTDGIPLYKSSGVGIWPIYLVINELPPKLRFSKKNMVLWGVWQAKGKPVFNTFLQPFIEEMKMLKEKGLTIVNGDGSAICTRAMLIAGTMDLQAKAYLVEMTQHNGQFGCLTCEHPGEVVSQGKGHARVYTPSECVQRTTEGMVQNALEANASQKPVKGIKGVSSLLGMQWFDVVNGIGPDYMHGVLLGVTKKLLQLLFSATHSKSSFSLSTAITVVDRRLKKMKPTDGIGRLPRPLENNIHHLKASELQNWLLYYAIPCLTGYMEEKYLNHLALFIEGIYIMLRDRISNVQLERAEHVLQAFYAQFSGLYGANNCTLNLHNACCHLPRYVKLLGPLWAWSCFPFENMNGSLLECVHGTGDVCQQILWVMQAKKRLSVDAGAITDKSLNTFTARMTSTKRAVNITKQANNCGIAGGLVSKPVSDAIKAKVEELMSDDAGKLLYASRVVVNGDVFFAKDYGRLTKRVCHFVLFDSDRNGSMAIAEIDHFLYHEKTNVCLAVIRRTDVQEDEPLAHPLVNHLLKVSTKQEATQQVIMVEQLKEKVLYLAGNKNCICISRFPNLHGLCS